MTDNLEFEVHCLCNKQRFNTSLPRSSLPLKGGVCHCNSCRSATGGMYTFDVTWPGPGEDIWQSSLQTYAFSKRLTLFFCGTCSTPMFFHIGDEKAPNDKTKGFFNVTAGVLPNLEGVELARITGHIFVEDTVDGGASVFMQRPNGDGELVKRWKGRRTSEEVDEMWPPVEVREVSKEDVPIRCHCGGVDLRMKRPTVVFAEVSKEELPDFVDPESKKAVVSFDACNSCRLMSGSHVSYWTFALVSHITFPDGLELPQDTKQLKQQVGDDKVGTLKMFASSEDVQRYFCGRCSATVFYACDKWSRQVDIAMGVLRADEGARGESFALWDFSMMGYMDDTVGWREGMMRAVKEGAEWWRIKRGIEKCWRRTD